MKKLTKEEVIKRAKKIHGNKYDYSLLEYKHSKKKVKIICPEHGVFEQIAADHLNGSGCVECSGKKMLTNETFKNRAREIHRNKYDYSLVEYIHTDKKIKIICPEHGIFEQTPHEHLKGSECLLCGNPRKGKKTNKKDFIEKAKKIHGDKYDYSLVKYINNKENIKIVCSKHGVFEQRPDVFLARKQECPKCSNNGTSKGEKQLFEYICSLCEEQVIENDRKIISPYEIDILIPSLKIGFEYNGDYWHSEERVGKNYHKNKEKLAYENGYRLFFIWESEWKNNNEKIKENIKNIFYKQNKE